MTAADLRDLFAFDDWATERLLAVAAALTVEQFTTHAGNGAASLQGVLSHMIAEEWLWLCRCRGENPEAVPAWAEHASPQALSRAFGEVQRGRRTFLAELTDAALAEEVSFQSLEGHAHRHRVGDILFHVVTHSTYHRGQIAMLLRQVGAAPVETDFVVFRETT